MVAVEVKAGSELIKFVKFSSMLEVFDLKVTNRSDDNYSSLLKIAGPRGCDTDCLEQVNRLARKCFEDKLISVHFADSAQAA